MIGRGLLRLADLLIQRYQSLGSTASSEPGLAHSLRWIPVRPDSRLRLSTRDVKSIIETVDASVVESTLGVYESAKAQQLSDSLGALDSAGCFRFAFFGKESADNSVDPLVVERTPDESTSRVTQVFPEALRYLSSDLERVDERPQTEVSAGAAQTSIEAAMRVLLDAGFRPLSAEDVELSDSLGSEPPGRLELRTDESRLDAAPLAHLVDPLAADGAPELRKVLVLVSGYSSEEKAGKQVLEKIDLVQAEAVQFFGRQGVDLLRKAVLLAKDTAVSVLDRADGWTRELGMPKRMRYRARAAWGGAQEGMHEGNAPAASGVPSARGDAREGSGETAKGMTEAEEEGRRRWEEGQVRVRAVLQRVGERARAKASAAVGAGIASAREAVSSVPLPGRDPGQSVQAIALRRRVELGRVHEVSQAGLTQALRAVRPFSADSGLWHFLTSDVSLREPVFREVAVLAWRRWPTPSSPPRLWVRSYRDIPVRSWRIVLPDRYLTFRPVDLLRADLISLAAVGGAIAGTRLDNEVLQLVSLVGAAGALVRVILTYYRIVAGGDCLVLRTLHGRTTAVGQAALSHVAVEAAQQQGAQAALAYAAAVHLKKRAVSAGGGGADAEQNAGGIASRQSAASGRESAGLSVGVKAKEGAPVRVDDVRRVVQGWLEEHGAVKEFRCGEAFAALERLGIVDMSDDKRMITVRTRLE